jgi:hypothetical protein
MISLQKPSNGLNDTTLLSLCQTCRSIDWQSFVLEMQWRRQSYDWTDDKYHDPWRELYVAISLPPWKNSTKQSTTVLGCAMCALFAEIKQDAGLDETWQSYVQSADSVTLKWTLEDNRTRYAPVISFIKDRVDSAPLGRLVGILHNESSQDQHAPRIIDPLSIDYSIVQGWLHECINEHSEDCSPDKSDPPIGFKVLDVQTCRVIKAPTDCLYVALSYVWGYQSHEQMCHEQTSQELSFPPTVKDAITVTSALGFRYICELAFR